MSFEAAIFDMDGLLLDTERLSRDAFVECSLHFGLEGAGDFFENLIGLNAKKSNALIETFLGGHVPLQTFETKWIGLYKEYLSGDIPVKAGVEALLSHFEQIELPCAVATSTRNESAQKYLGRAELLSFFQLIVGGDQVNNGKPSPDIYILAAEKIGVSPEKCIAFEDSENGVRAAVGAGMTVVQVPDLIQPSEDLKLLGHIVAETLLEGAAYYNMYPKSHLS